MTIENMRLYIADAYPTPNWKKRIETMSSEQIVAIYYSILTRKRAKLYLDRHEKKKTKPIKKESIHQITLDEYFYKGEMK